MDYGEEYALPFHLDRVLLYFIDLRMQKKHSEQNLSLGYMISRPVRVFKIRKFKPQYSYKVYSYIKKSMDETVN